MLKIKQAGVRWPGCFIDTGNIPNQMFTDVLALPPLSFPSLSRVCRTDDPLCEDSSLQYNIAMLRVQLKIVCAMVRK